MNESTATTATALPELHPDWCGRDRDCYDQIPDAASHASPMKEQGAAQAQIEQTVNWVGGRNIEQEPSVLAWMHGELIGDQKNGLSAAGCRDLAAVLLATADKLDEALAVVDKHGTRASQPA